MSKLIYEDTLDKMPLGVFLNARDGIIRGWFYRALVRAGMDHAKAEELVESAHTDAVNEIDSVIDVRLKQSVDETVLWKSKTWGNTK